MIDQIVEQNLHSTVWKAISTLLSYCTVFVSKMVEFQTVWCIESCVLSKFLFVPASLTKFKTSMCLDQYIFGLTKMILGLFYAWVYFALDFDQFYLDVDKHTVQYHP